MDPWRSSWRATSRPIIMRGFAPRTPAAGVDTTRTIGATTRRTIGAATRTRIDTARTRTMTIVRAAVTAPGGRAQPTAAATIDLNLWIISGIWGDVELRPGKRRAFFMRALFLCRD